MLRARSTTNRFGRFRIEQLHFTAPTMQTASQCLIVAVSGGSGISVGKTRGAYSSWAKGGRNVFFLAREAKRKTKRDSFFSFDFTMAAQQTRFGGDKSCTDFY